VNDVSITVNPGELLCLVGPSGCGKTTLLKIISGLLYPDGGRVWFGDQDMVNVPPEKRYAAMVFQNHLLFPFMSVLENVGFGARMRGTSRAEWEPKARAMLDQVHLLDLADRRPESLSAGQKQRVALARALVADPAVLLLDEPLSNLDRHLREDMRQVIIDLQRETGVTAVCVTHDQEEAVLLGDRIAMLTAGRLVQLGEAQDFYERPVSVHVARFFGNHNQIEAMRNGLTIDSDLGPIKLDPQYAEAAGTRYDWPDTGQVCVHVRPESLSLLPAGSNTENAVRGRIVHRVYVGTHVRYVVDVAGQPWQVVAGPLADRFDEQATVDVVIPPDRIWLTPE
jgi:ABC-type Fe3+/spermidine/putrescine transport system ATPase subunit